MPVKRRAMTLGLMGPAIQMAGLLWQAAHFYFFHLHTPLSVRHLVFEPGLLMVFVGLEISSISTYIMAGFRKGQAPSTEASIKYFLLGSFATAFFLYGIALAFGSTGSTRIDAISLGHG